MTLCVVCRRNMFQGLHCQICKIRFHQRCGDALNNMPEYQQCDPLRMCKSEKALIEHMLSLNMERYHFNMGRGAPSSAAGKVGGGASGSQQLANKVRSFCCGIQWQ